MPGAFINAGHFGNSKCSENIRIDSPELWRRQVIEWVDLAVRFIH